MVSVCESLGCIVRDGGPFLSEYTALKTDEELGVALVACLAGTVEGMAEGAGPPCPEAINALVFLSLPFLEAAVYKRATRPGGGYVRLLGQALGRLLATPVEGVEDAHQAQTLSAALRCLDVVFRQEDHPGLFEELLPFLATAVAAGIRLREMDPNPRIYNDGASALCDLLAELADREPPGAAPYRPPAVDAALARHPLEAVRLAEALGRMSAAIRGALAGAHPLGLPLELANALLSRAESATPHLHRAMAAAPRAAYLSPEGLGAVAGLLASSAKVAQQLFSSWRPGTDPELYRHGQQVLPALTSLGFMLLRAMTQLEFGEGGGEASLSREVAEQSRR